MNEKDIKYDVALSSRVRFARNLADYPFSAKCDPTSAKEIIEKVEGALGDGYVYTDFTGLDENAAYAAVEDHSVSREFAEATIPHRLASSKDGKVKIMICEEDHIRLQAITPGLSLTEAYDTACAVDDRLGEKLNIAFDDRLGFLTQCPTNIGTGMRASVMLFLPALTARHKIKPLAPQLSKLGMTIRGIYGEGSEALGCVYQISNQETIGVTEESVIAKITSTIDKIIEIEREERKSLYEGAKDNLTDKVMRSLGILKYAYTIDSSEFMKRYADVRLGISLGIIDGVDLKTLDDLFVAVMPYTIMRDEGGEVDVAQRDLIRARRIKERLN